MKKVIVRLISLLLMPLYIFTSCGGNKGAENAENQTEKKSDTSSIAIGVNGKVFIIPSPIQTAMLIQKSGAQYDKTNLNGADKVNSYSTKFQKCMNLGIYGADLGYITLYDQNQDALIYFKATNMLANDLGLSSAFDKAFLERFQKNIGKKDSMLSLVSVAYRASNDFLKHNDRNEDAVLIIAGGWVETLHFALNVMKTKGNEDVKQRIADQKNTLANLILLLSAYQGNEEYAELLKNLNDLKSEYDKVQYKYVYDRPVTDEATKTTTITSKSEVTISPETMQEIDKKVAAIRKMITA